MIKIKLFAVTLCILLLSPFAWSNTQSTISSQASQAGQFISDSAVTTAVKANLLADSDIKSLVISVSTQDGVVTLSGSVDNELQRQKAFDIASKTSGVKSVKNDLVIASPKPKE